MNELFESPVFGIALSALAYWAGQALHRRTRLTALNPLLVAIALVCAVLLMAAGGGLTAYGGLQARDILQLALGAVVLAAAACLLLALARWRRGDSCGGLCPAPAAAGGL